MSKCDFASGNNVFASEFCKVQSQHLKGKNFIVSPFSVNIILALVRLGAKDATAQEIQKVTHLLCPCPCSDKDVLKLIEGCFKSLQIKDATLHTANKIYIKQEMAIKDNFKRDAVNVFKAGIEGVDFSKNIETAQIINKWVESQTENKISNLIDPKVIRQGTRAVLINALYFQAKWLDEFTLPTMDADFYLNAKDKISVPTMTQTTNYQYCENSALKAKFLKMPLMSHDAFFVIILPDAKDGLATLESQKNLFSKQKYKENVDVELSLPKFKIETSSELSDQLSNLGIKKMFSEEADLSGIAGSKGELFVGSVVQKVFINIDEKGIEAAAATAAEAGETAQWQQNIIPFVVDHPFMFFITVNDIVLLAGRVLDPRQ